jgi:formylglycine-generating enzyme required for sulfatase activity
MVHHVRPLGGLVVFLLVLFSCAGTRPGEPARESEPPSRAPPAAVREPVLKLAAVVAAASPQPAPPCPSDMVLVDGDYCTQVRQDCAERHLRPGSHCTSFLPSVCTGKRVHERFCIDRDEYVPPGETLPKTWVTWYKARDVCASLGKRLCAETEWELACEGPEILPYPFGLSREAGRCNYDHVLDVIDPATGKLRDLRGRPEAFDGCTSAYGVRNMVGNVDEWVERDVPGASYRSALKGGWWMPVRNRCRPVTTEHSEWYLGVQVGFRCCERAP